jgi:hypothetical protein
MKSNERPDFETLIDWLEGRLPAEAAQALARELGLAGEETQADLEWLQGFLQASRTARLVAPPAALRQSLRQRFAEFAAGRRPAAFFQRLRAALTFDSRLHPASAGVRAATSVRRRQFIYDTALAEIALDLRLRPEDGHINLLGQVFPSGDIAPESFSIHLFRGEAEAGITVSDDLGEFSFTGLPAGVYEIILSTDGFEILLSSVQIQI